MIGKFSAFFLFFFLFYCSLSAEVKIGGKLISSNPALIQNAELDMVEYNPEKKDDKFKHMDKTKADSQGEFQFDSFEPEKGLKYFVTVFFEGVRVPSELIEYQGQDSLEFVIEADKLFENEASSKQTPKELTVKGRLLGVKEGEAVDIPLMLLKFDPAKKDGPPMSPVIRGQSKANGDFEFPPFQPEPGVSYLVGALVDGQRISSEMVEYKSQEKLFFFVQIPSQSGATDTEKFSGELKVTGRLVSAGEIPAGKIPLMLLRFKPGTKDGPPMSPVIRSEAKADGSFEFPPIKPEAGVSYLVGALINDQRISSSMQPYSGEKKMEFVLDIPVFSDDYSALDFLKSFLIFTPLTDGVRVTEVTSVFNSGKANLQSKDKAPSKALPAGAENLSYFAEGNLSESQVFENNRFVLRENLPPGPTNLVIEYDLKRSFDGLEFKHEFFKGTREVELMTKEGELEIYTGDLFLRKEDKKFGKTNYKTYSGEIDPSKKSIVISLGSLPIPLFYLIGLAGLVSVALLLLVSLAFLKNFKSKRLESIQNPL